MANDSPGNEFSTITSASQDDCVPHFFEVDHTDLRKRVLLLEEEKEKLQHLVCYLLKKNEDLRRILYHR